MRLPLYTPLQTLLRGQRLSWAQQRAIRALLAKAHTDGYMRRANPADEHAERYAKQLSGEYVKNGCRRLGTPEHHLSMGDESTALDEITTVVLAFGTGHLSERTALERIKVVIKQVHHE